MCIRDRHRAINSKPIQKYTRSTTKKALTEICKKSYFPGPSTSCNSKVNKKTSKSNSSRQLRFSAAIVEIDKDV